MTLPESTHWLTALEIGEWVFRCGFSNEEITQTMPNRIEDLTI